VPGLYLNSYAVSCEGAARLHHLTGTVDTNLRALRRDLGVSLWGEDDSVYAYADPGVACEDVTEVLRPLRRLGLFALREALVAHAGEFGFDAWIGRGQEIQIRGMTEAAVEDRFRIEPVLHLRLGREAHIEADAVITARHRNLWRCADALSEPDVAVRAVGHPAVRLRGTGPRRGRVKAVAGDELVLDLREGPTSVAADDYTLAVNSAFIAAWRGSDVLHQVRLSAGEITHSGQRNRYGVQERFRMAGGALRRLGGEIPVRGGAVMRIPERAVQVRLEARP
jgi:hypothetical protein